MKDCDIFGKERMLAIVFILNGYPKRFKKLTDKINIDHLKGFGTYLRTVGAAKRLLISHSSAVVVNKRQRDSEVAFGKTYINDKEGYTKIGGSCNISKEGRHHIWEYNNKIKQKNYQRRNMMTENCPYRIYQSSQQQWVVMLRSKHKCWQVVQKQLPIMIAIMIYLSLCSFLLDGN